MQKKAIRPKFQKFYKNQAIPQLLLIFSFQHLLTPQMNLFFFIGQSQNK